jgi:ABC-type amino acid transport substrate-binding protein
VSDLITYPTAAMQQTAREIRALLDAQWARHMALYKTSPNSFIALTQSLSNGLPDGKGQAVQNGVEAWHQKMEKNYASLYAIADALENGSINAVFTDEDLTNLFTGFE